MPDEKIERMTLVERLRNPQWVHTPCGNPALDVDKTCEDMKEAAEVIENARR